MPGLRSACPADEAGGTFVAQGRHDQALRWLATVREENAHDAVMLPQLLLLRTRAYAAIGDLSAAQRSGQQLLRLWRDAEPMEQHRLDEAMRGAAHVVAMREATTSGH